MGLRLSRIDPRPLAWAVASVVLAAGGGLLVAGSPAVAFDIAVICLAAALLRQYPFAVLIVILVARAGLPNSVLIGFLALGAGALALILAAPRLGAKRVVVPFLALLLIAFASVPFSPSLDEGYTPPLQLPLLGGDYAGAPSIELLAWMNLASVLTVFCIAGWAVTTRSRLQTLVVAVLLSALVPIGIALQQLATGHTVTRSGSTLQSLRGPFTYPNYFAFYLVVVLIIAIVVMLESRSLAVRGALSLFLLVALVCLFLTYTRAGWIGFAMALLTLAVLRYRSLLIVAAVAVLLAVLIAPGAATKAQQRFGDLTSKSESHDSNSWRWRVDQWSAILPYGFERPLTGQGFGSYSRVTVRRFGHSDPRYPTIQKPYLGVYSPLGFTAHNDYVKMFVEMGIPGLVLWILVFVGVIRTAARARRVRGLEPIATGVLAVTLALLLISVSDNLQGYTVVLMYAFAVCGALAGVTRAAAGSHAAPEASAAHPASAAPPLPVEMVTEPTAVAEPAALEPEAANRAATDRRAKGRPSGVWQAAQRGRDRARGLLGRARRRRP
jgi:putative inorganic carbon (HCO3(-)) transporter